jgi:hypothetical protein
MFEPKVCQFHPLLLDSEHPHKGKPPSGRPFAPPDFRIQESFSSEVYPCNSEKNVRTRSARARIAGDRMDGATTRREGLARQGHPTGTHGSINTGSQDMSVSFPGRAHSFFPGARATDERRRTSRPASGGGRETARNSATGVAGGGGGATASNHHPRARRLHGVIGSDGVVLVGGFRSDGTAILCHDMTIITPRFLH